MSFKCYYICMELVYINQIIVNTTNNQIAKIAQINEASSTLTCWTPEGEECDWCISDVREADGWEAMSYYSENSNWMTAEDVQEAFA